MTQLFTYQGFSFRAAPFHLRLLVTAFIALASVGMAVGFLEHRLAAAAAATPRELLERTRLHIFQQAFLVFVLGHLLALCAWPARRKNAVYLAGFGGILLGAGSPWLVRYADPAFAWLQLAGDLLLLGAFLALTGVPLREMWWRGSRA